MKRLGVVIGLAAALVLVGCLEPPRGSKSPDTGVIYRHHFAGMTAIAAGTNAAKVKEVSELPALKRMASEVVAKLAKAPRELWKKHLPAKASNGGELILPILEDIFAAESLVEVRGSLARPEWIVAAQISDDRARLWDKNLRALTAAWELGKPAEVTAHGFKGWEIKRGGYPNRVQVLRAGKWMVAGWGSDKLPLSTELLEAAAKSGRLETALATNVLLNLEADLPRIGTVVPAMGNYRFPPVQLSVSGRGEFLRTEAQFRYSQPLSWKFEPWRIPTNIIPEKIVTFTAAQGIAPLLKTIEGVPELGLKQLPNQVSMWGIGDAPGQVFAAFPYENASNAMQKLAHTMPPVLSKRFSDAMGQIGWVSNRAALLWQGIPFVVPYLEPLRVAGTEYLFFGMFPRLVGSNAPPAELFAQLGGRKDLVYYDWEVTGARLPHARQLYQLNYLARKRLLPDSKSAGEVWLRALGDVIGPTITEISVKSPTELSLVRKSHIGFTAFELTTFSLWLESGGFPLRFEPRPPVPGSNAVPRKATSGAPGESGK